MCSVLGEGKRICSAQLPLEATVGGFRSQVSFELEGRSDEGVCLVLLFIWFFLGFFLACQLFFAILKGDYSKFLKLFDISKNPS